jgi:hypothetical protein
VRLVQQGDRGALEALVEGTGRGSTNVARRMVYLPQDADDATPEIPDQGESPSSDVRGRSRLRRAHRVAVNHRSP